MKRELELKNVQIKLSLSKLLITLVFTGKGHTSHSVHIEVKGCHVGPGDQTQAARLSGKCLYLLSQFTGPRFFHSTLGCRELSGGKGLAVQA